MSKLTVQCLNPAAHGVTEHIAGSAAAIACQQTNGRSVKMEHIVKPPRQVFKGNNIGNVSVLTNIDPTALDWAAANISRHTPRDVRSLIETASSNANLANNYRDFVRPFINMIHDEGYSDEFGENALLPDPTNLGFGYTEPNDQTQKIIDQSKAPGFQNFINALASEMDTDSDAAAAAYKVLSGYLGNEDYSKVYAVGCLRSEYLDRVEEVSAINAELKGLKEIFDSEVDDGVVVDKKHGISFADGDGIQFTPRRVFNYDEAAPLPIPKNATDEEKEAIKEQNKERLSPDDYKKILKGFEPKYVPLGEIEKILEKEDFSNFTTWGSTAVSIK